MFSTKHTFTPPFARRFTIITPTSAAVQAAIAAKDLVVVGMRQNPWPKKARQALDATGIPYKYLEYGSYLSEWRRRLALKMWTGCPKFPMVFIRGTLVGGAEEVKRLIESGELKQMISQTSGITLNTLSRSAT
jgi:monothiol glutaredoxin